MNIFFEESGSLKAGAVLEVQGEAFQVELPGGRRAKVRAKEVLFEFEGQRGTALGEWMQATQESAEQIDLDFLWECAPSEAFELRAFSEEYFGAKPTSMERAALALRLHGAPMYFRRKGRGNYQRAPEEQLKAALAGLERRKQQALVQAEYENELKAHRLPSAFQNKVLELLTAPDKNTIEYKALETASIALGKTHAQLMLACQGIPSARALHEARFLAQSFPKGIGFAAEDLPTYTCEALTTRVKNLELPEAEVQAFSIDDITTTEIDDAFSVQILAEDRVRIGIHIAAPALGINPGSPLDMELRNRLSTVYMPGDKITMLPQALVDTFTLEAGSQRPALSLYTIIDTTTQQIVTSETRIERVWIADNLRHHTLETEVTEEALATGSGDYPYKAELALIWPFAQALYEKRQQARVQSGLRRETQNQRDFSFYIDEEEHVSIVPRDRHSPINFIVAELAILANSTWGGLLAGHGVPGIYRAQRAFGPNRTRMQLTAAPHEGLGVAQYAWSTSPLRRYIDLLNQWQLIACARDGVAARLCAPFQPKDAELYIVAQRFTDTYADYSEHQGRMERFWCLRWLLQENLQQVRAIVIKGDLVRLEDIPLTLHIPELGIQASGTALLLHITHIDELELTASARLLKILNAEEPAAAPESEEEDGDADSPASEAAAPVEETACK